MKKITKKKRKKLLKHLKYQMKRNAFVRYLLSNASISKVGETSLGGEEVTDHYGRAYWVAAPNPGKPHNKTVIRLGI